MTHEAGPRVRRDPRIDAAVWLWALLWLGLGIWTGAEVWRLGNLTDTVVDSGYAINDAGQALQGLDPVPVVGDSAAQLGTQIRENARDIVDDAQRAGSSFRRLAVLLGVAIALVPSVPVILLRAAVRRTPLGSA